MKKMITANMIEENPSDYLISCLQDGVISEWAVLREFIAYCSEDDIREIIDTLGLYELLDE